MTQDEREQKAIWAEAELAAELVAKLKEQAVAFHKRVIIYGLALGGDRCHHGYVAHKAVVDACEEVFSWAKAWEQEYKSSGVKAE